MNNIVYIVGAVVIVLFILGFIGLRLDMVAATSNPSRHPSRRNSTGGPEAAAFQHRRGIRSQFFGSQPEQKIHLSGRIAIIAD